AVCLREGLEIQAIQELLVDVRLQLHVLATHGLRARRRRALTIRDGLDWAAHRRLPERRDFFDAERAAPAARTCPRRWVAPAPGETVEPGGNLGGAGEPQRHAGAAR